MKKLVLIIGCLACSITFAQTINFPDPDLKTELINQGVDTSADGEIQVAEAQARTSLFLNGFQVSDTGGLEFFTSLTLLSINNLQATSIDLSQLTNLERLFLSGNLTSLNISNNTALEELSLSSLSISSIDLSSNTQITTLDLILNNNLTTIDLSTLVNLEDLKINSLVLSSLSLTNNTAITTLNLQSLSLSSIDISALTALQSLNIISCNFNSLSLTNNLNLTFLQIINAPNITSLDITNNTLLTNLIVIDASLSSMNLSNNVNLSRVELSENSLTMLDASMLSSLVDLYVNDNANLSSLILKSQADNILEQLYAYNTSLTQIELTNFTALKEVDLRNNNLSLLNIKNGNNANITGMNASGNPNLTCITVDDPAAASGYTGWNKDAGATYSIACRPFPTILNAPANTSTSFTAQFEFDRDVTGFTINDIVLTNATASNFTATSTTLYSALITPSSICDVDITIDVPLAAAQGVANGDDSEPAVQIVVETIDNIDPVAITQNITVNLDAAGNATITEAQINNGSSDNCAIDSLSLDITAFDCTTVGANTVTLTVEDDEGNTDTATAVVTVVDNTAPTLSCQNTSVTLDTNGAASIVVGDILTTASDNCGVTNFSVDTTTFTCSDIGTNTVILTAIDVNGNTTTCTATVTVNDTTNPTTVCQNITAFLDATGNAVITPAAIDNGSTDNCNFTLSLDTATFDCNDIGLNSVTLTTTDSAGNVDTCGAVVTVVDDLSPNVITNNITVQLDATGTATITPANIDNGSTDNCTIDTLSLDTTSFNCPDVGANTVTLTVTDVNGNSASATAVVTVEDNIAPTVACQDITVQLDASGNATIVVADVLTGSADNCGVNVFALDTNTFDCSDLGSNTITLTATDVNGNTATCTSIVTVEDGINPTATCQNITVQLDANGEVTITGADLDNGSTDNCAIDSLSVDISSFVCDDIGTNNVVLTVTDVAGNTSTCTAVVTVVDDVAPVVTCPADFTVSVDPAVGYEVPDYFATNDASATDNCTAPVTLLSQSPTPGTFLATGSTYTITMTGEDASGNDASCTFDVTVDDILNTPENSLATVSVYPNPVEKIVMISNPNSAIIDAVTIYDVTGRKVYEQLIGNTLSKISVDFSTLDSASYFMIITAENGTITKQLIKK